MGSHQQIVERSITSLKPYAANARTHSKKQVKQIAASITRFGFTNPVLISDDGEIIAGHGRVEAAKSLGWKAVPTLALSHLSATERSAYVVADNKLALNAGWDRDILAIELQALIDFDFDVELTGFSLAEIDLVLDEASDADPAGSDAEEDQVTFATGKPVSRHGDLWILGRHKLLCGDARSSIDFEALLGGERADLVFTDPPYNVKIDGNVCGLGTVKHREFAFASGEMSENQFTEFLTATLKNASSVMGDGKLPVPITGQVVGYGRPPAEHRFQKGRSGNPGGRPPRSKNKPKPFDPASQPTDNLILEEAYRPVTIREGERTIELPAIQAAVRALAIQASVCPEITIR